MKLKIKKSNINIAKLIAVVTALTILEVSIIVTMIIYNYFMKGAIFNRSNDNSVSLFLYVVVFLVIINSIITIKSVYSEACNRMRNEESVNATMKQLEELNNTLRGQRHDFMNHLQVVYSLMEMGEYIEACGYIDKVYKDIQKVNRFLKTSNPAINALLQAKAIFAEKRGISFEINIRSQLEELKITSWELCRVLGNIIDNAIYALQAKGEGGIVKISIYEDIKLYTFRIENNGEQIPDSILNKIFEIGYTTKAEHGQGMGLAISKEIVEAVEGEIKVNSSDMLTSFEVNIPK